jgi:hypothetical protein
VITSLSVTIPKTSPPSAPTFGYSLTNTHNPTSNTLSILHKLNTPLSPTLPTTATPSPYSLCPNAATTARYRTLIRQLPPRTSITRLAALYFREFNWQYAVLDQSIFDCHLDKWYRLPFETLCGDREMRAFPALVFQVCAVALLMISLDDGDEEEREESRAVWEGLRYAGGGGVGVEELAAEWSGFGVEVLGCLGKRGMGVVSVLAGWVRAKWLKYGGLVTEAVSLFPLFSSSFSGVGLCLRLFCFVREGGLMRG